VAWSAAHPLNIGYRWFNEAGKVVERDGMRTSISMLPAPGNEVAVTLSGRTPEEPGNYRLRASLVLEGVHWACDVAEHGWTELHVQVRSAPAWPQELSDLAGGKALRGAVARAALARSLEGDIPNVLIEQVNHTSAILSIEGSNEMSVANSLPVIQGNRFRNWVRRTLGIRNVQRDLEAVANALTRQEQRSAELHNYLERLERRLGESSTAIQDDVVRLTGDLRQDRIFNKLTALEVNRSLAAIRTELRAQSDKSKRLLAGHEQIVRTVNTLQKSLEAYEREAR